MPPPDRTCVSCGRDFAWRRKWARNWDEIRYCSDACRRHGVTAVDRDLEAWLRDRIAVAATADPAAAARAFGDEQALREPARRAARRIVAAGDADITQRGRVVDPATARGDFVLRRRP